MPRLTLGISLLPLSSWDGCVAKEVSILGGNSDLVLFKSFSIEPQETNAVHVLEQNEYIFIWDVFPIGVVFSILTKGMGKATLFLVATKIHAGPDVLLQKTFVGESFGGRGSFFDVEEAHL
jgi:hypothetical protein